MVKMFLIFVISCSSTLFAQSVRADVQAVHTKGTPGAYTFAVKLKSTETGCDQYADWWEVLSEEGELIYRRVLLHSHPNEQPFTRSGGKVKIGAEDVVYVRAHMNNVGYIGDVMKGSVSSGFKVVTELPNFSKNIDKQDPLPQECLY